MALSTFRDDAVEQLAIVEAMRAGDVEPTRVVQNPLDVLAQLIVAMDEVLDGKEPLTNAGADALVKQAHSLLVASEAGEAFSKHYFDALQRDPDVVLAHAKAAKLFRARSRPG